MAKGKNKVQCSEKNLPHTLPGLSPAWIALAVKPGPRRCEALSIIPNFSRFTYQSKEFLYCIVCFRESLSMSNIFFSLQ